MPPKIPGLPDINPPPNPLEIIRKGLREGQNQIGKARQDLHSITGGPLSLTSRPSATGITEAKPASSPGVSDADTLRYQLKNLIDALDQLGLHLSEECKILNVPCDCCEKHGGRVRAFALETIPIAARQGKTTDIFTSIADWGGFIEEIGTEQNAQSGLLSKKYRDESGRASVFAKDLRKMKAKLQNGGCASCAEMKESLADFIKTRKKEA